MTATTLEQGRLEFSPLIIAMTGAVTLAAAMGVGRFGFTPLLPMMLHDGAIDLQGGSLLATANYVGYLIGALICMVLPASLRRLGLPMVSNAAMVRFGLAATVVLTIAMALHAPGAWAAIRFISGITSAFVFVFMSGWCLKRLAEMNALSFAGVIYTGPGIGITLTGGLAYGVSASGGSAGMGWVAFGILAAILSAIVWPVFRPDAMTKSAGANAAADSQPAPRDRWTMEQPILAVAYGLAGFGYIITATFLPVIAREALGQSGWIELFWPLFGIGVAVGALLTRVIPLSIDRRLLLIGCYVVQAIGVVATLVLPSVAGFMIGSALVGLPFTVISLCGMQEARRLRPVDATSFMALMTATYGIGQIVGPPLAAAILAHSATHEIGFSLSLTVASGALLIGGALCAFNMLRYPLGR